MGFNFKTERGSKQFSAFNSRHSGESRNPVSSPAPLDPGFRRGDDFWEAIGHG